MVVVNPHNSGVPFSEFTIVPTIDMSESNA
jgi:hypothetical protein